MIRFVSIAVALGLAGLIALLMTMALYLRMEEQIQPIENLDDRPPGCYTDGAVPR